MQRLRLLVRRWMIATAIVLILVALAIWTIRPSPFAEWLGAEGLANYNTPLLILRAWTDGGIAPVTPSGFITLFPLSDLLILLALLAALCGLLVLLLTDCRKEWTGAWLTRPILPMRLPRIGMRVGTAMGLIAIVGLDLGWEIAAWRNWRLSTRYRTRASSYTTQEASWRQSLDFARSRLAAIDAKTSESPEEDSWTPAAQAASRAYTRDIWQRDAAYASSQLVVLVELRRKYERAAADPTRPVPPDPPRLGEQPRTVPGDVMVPGEYAQSLVRCDRLIQLYPDLPLAHRERAWLLATCPDARFRDGKAAVAAATRAAELTNRKDAGVLFTLAAAYAEAGEFASAVRWQQRGLELEQAFMKQFPPPGGGMVGMRVIEDRLTMYKAGKPFRMER